MNPLFLLSSFVAGILTVIAPCVLPLLPIIISGSATSKSYKKPFIISISLALSVILFTLLLKASTLLIDIPQNFWKYFSGGLLIAFGIAMIFPILWTKISLKLGFEESSNKFLNKASGEENILGSILLGASLGPVFSSCSPTYFVILATVLPVSFLAGIIYLLVYALGLALILFLIGIFGQKLIKKLKFAANPNGNFRKGIGILILIVGLSIISGIDKKVELYLIDRGFGVTALEEFLLNKSDMTESSNPEAQESTDGTDIPILYKAPEFTGLKNWINSDEIKSMEELKGKVVIIDFWTYSCINCIRTLPYLQSWHEKYSEDGLVIIGVHAPEFQFEQKFENVQKAVKDFGLSYPVVQDNDFMLWRAYKNRYWPAKYIVDKDGFVRYEHFGEGEYEETEKIITGLLGTEMKNSDIEATEVDFKQIKTPETYIGLGRRENFIASATSDMLHLNEWTLVGDFFEDDEKVVTYSEESSIIMKFKASKANIVLGGIGKAEIYIDGEKTADLEIDGNKLYEVANFGDKYEEHTIEIKFLNEGIELYAWTFG